MAFDALFVGGRTLLERPLIERKRQLAGVLKDNDIAQVSEFIEGDGKVFFDATCEHGLEGIMAKDKASPYLPGERSPNWQKIKRLRECAFVVAGYDFGGRRRAASLRLADPGPLRQGTAAVRRTCQRGVLRRGGPRGPLHTAGVRQR